MTHNRYSQNCTTYILVHGAWHGAWCWDKVIPLLQAMGHKTIAVDLPGHGKNIEHTSDISLDDYVNEIVKAVLDNNEPVVLVGHSMSGIAISQAAEKLGPARISALVYLDAFLPKNGDSLFSLVEATLKQLSASASRKPLLAENIIVAEDRRSNWVNPGMVTQIFYHDCSEQDQKFALANISKEPIAPLATPLSLSDDVYGAIPKYYILCTESQDMDKTFLSTNMPVKKVYKLASGHSPFFSMPGELVNILNGISLSVQSPEPV